MLTFLFFLFSFFGRERYQTGLERIALSLPECDSGKIGLPAKNLTALSICSERTHSRPPVFVLIFNSSSLRLRLPDKRYTLHLSKIYLDLRRHRNKFVAGQSTCILSSHQKDISRCAFVALRLFIGSEISATISREFSSSRARRSPVPMPL